MQPHDPNETRERVIKVVAAVLGGFFGDERGPAENSGHFISSLAIYPR